MMANLANIPTVSVIAAWCDFQVDDDVAGLLTLLGAKTSTQTRSIIAAIAEQLFGSTSQKWLFPPDVCPSPALQAKAGMLGAVVRLTHEKRARRQKAMDLKGRWDERACGNTARRGTSLPDDQFIISFGPS